MIKNGHHAANVSETERETVGNPAVNVSGPEKRKRIVQVWCDGWYVVNVRSFACL